MYMIPGSVVRSCAPWSHAAASCCWSYRTLQWSLWNSEKSTINHLTHRSPEQVLGERVSCCHDGTGVTVLLALWHDLPAINRMGIIFHYTVISVSALRNDTQIIRLFSSCHSIVFLEFACRRHQRQAQRHWDRTKRFEYSMSCVQGYRYHGPATHTRDKDAMRVLASIFGSECLFEAESVGCCHLGTSPSWHFTDKSTEFVAYDTALLRLVQPSQWAL
jgi:hypothetical protein